MTRQHFLPVFLFLFGIAAKAHCHGDSEGGALAALSISARSYRMISVTTDPLARLDMQKIKLAYARHAFAQYSQAKAMADQLAQRVDAFLSSPNAQSLQTARNAWIAARPSYLYTEVFRFYDGPIDATPISDGAQRASNLESRINAWPLNEALLDYVTNAPDVGLLQDLAKPLGANSIIALDQSLDESDVTTGWHAIEFLLWGQDLDRVAPGQRPASDYLPDTAVKQRRRLYLQTLVQMLQQDLASLAQSWDLTRPESYGNRFVALDDYEAIGRMLSGAATLAATELASERLSVALDSGEQEDEQSCFSDTSSADLRAGVQGIHLLLDAKGAGLLKALKTLDAAAAKRLDIALQNATQTVARIPTPFDRMLASTSGSSARVRGEAAVLALQALAQELVSSGRAFGVLVSSR
jgi:putative iron-regulated protein